MSAITFRFPAPASDAELKEKLADKLRYDRVGYGILFNNLTLDVQNGVATIGGQVHDYPSRDSALAVAETMPGVKDVVDNIEVLPTSIMDDDLRIRVARAIYGNTVLSRYATDPQKPIRIVVDNGHVSLYGVVDSAMDKQIAVTQAKSVPNVFSVDNHLMVANSTRSSFISRQRLYRRGRDVVSIYNQYVAFLRDLRVTLEMIKWEHSIFALPFAFCGAFLAAGGIPSWRQLGWIIEQYA